MIKSGYNEIYKDEEREIELRIKRFVSEVNSLPDQVMDINDIFKDNPSTADNIKSTKPLDFDLLCDIMNKIEEEKVNNFIKLIKSHIFYVNNEEIKRKIVKGFTDEYAIEASEIDINVCTMIPKGSMYYIEKEAIK